MFTISHFLLLQRHLTFNFTNLIYGIKNITCHSTSSNTFSPESSPCLLSRCCFPPSSALSTPFFLRSSFLNATAGNFSPKLCLHFSPSPSSQRHLLLPPSLTANSYALYYSHRPPFSNFSLSPSHRELSHLPRNVQLIFFQT